MLGPQALPAMPFDPQPDFLIAVAGNSEGGRTKLLSPLESFQQPAGCDQEDAKKEGLQLFESKVPLRLEYCVTGLRWRVTRCAAS